MLYSKIMESQDEVAESLAGRYNEDVYLTWTPAASK